MNQAAARTRRGVPSLAELIAVNRSTGPGVTALLGAPVQRTPVQVIECDLHDLQTSEPLVILAGVGLADADIVAAVSEVWAEYGLTGFDHLEAVEGNWGWTGRFKHCADYDTGWACDSAGEWHRHYSSTAGAEPRTAVFGRHRDRPTRQGRRIQIRP
jgi:hypothetical protein